MKKSEDLRRLVAAFAKRPLVEMTGSTRLTEDLGLRSIKRIELGVMLEDSLGCPVSDALIMSVKTLGELEARLAVAAAGAGG